MQRAAGVDGCGAANGAATAAPAGEVQGAGINRCAASVGLLYGKCRVSGSTFNQASRAGNDAGKKVAAGAIQGEIKPAIGYRPADAKGSIAANEGLRCGHGCGDCPGVVAGLI